MCSQCLQAAADNKRRHEREAEQLKEQLEQELAQAQAASAAAASHHDRELAEAKERLEREYAVLLDKLQSEAQSIKARLEGETEAVRFTTEEAKERWTTLRISQLLPNSLHGSTLGHNIVSLLLWSSTSHHKQHFAGQALSHKTLPHFTDTRGKRPS